MDRHGSLHGLASLAASFVLIAACTGGQAPTATAVPTPTAPTAAFPLGKWTVAFSGGGVGLMEYRADGTWTYSDGATVATVAERASGTYKVEGDRINFSTDTYCQGAEQATYSWTHGERQLTLDAVDDKCTDRVQALDGQVYGPVK